MISVTPFLFVVLLAAVENAVIPVDDPDNRILGGEKASIIEFPSMAFLFNQLTISGLGNACGATIISERWVLTAAHCVDGALVSQVRLSVGHENMYYGLVHHASRIIVHEEFILEERHGTFVDVQNDIAVVEVEEPFLLNDFTIKAARLPNQDQEITPGILVTAVGWGDIGENRTTDVLHKANLQIMSTKQCKGQFPPNISIDKRTVCVSDPEEGKGTCGGDSGGPLFSDDVVIGITSFGDKLCTREVQPSVFTKVAHFRDWIMQKTGI